MDSESFERGKVEEEQAAESSFLSIRAMLGVSPVAKSTGDLENGTLERGTASIIVDFQRVKIKQVVDYLDSKNFHPSNDVYSSMKCRLNSF